MRRLLAAALLAVPLLATPTATAAVPTCGGLEATMVYGDGPDDVTGTDGDDVVVLGGGDDSFEGWGGDDVVCAGDGDDYVSGTSNHVRAYLGSGNDHAQVWWQGWLDAGPGNDVVVAAYGATVYGRGGADELSSQAAEPKLFGGPGDDVLRVGASRPDVHGGGGEDLLAVWFDDEPAAIDLAKGTIYNRSVGTVEIDGIEDVEGTFYDDVIKGDSGANRLVGGAGDDVIWGRGGDDVVTGGRGKDRADGGPGHDRCIAETKVRC